MIVEPREVTALAMVREVLSDLSGERGDPLGVRPGGWTYPRLPTVHGWPLPPLGLQMNTPDLPRLYVLAASGSQFEGAAQTFGKIAYRENFFVDIHGFAAADESADADTWRFRLLSDVFETLHANWTLFKTAPDGLDFTQRAGGVDNGELGHIAVFVLPVSVRLRPWTQTTRPPAA